MPLGKHIENALDLRILLKNKKSRQIQFYFLLICNILSLGLHFLLDLVSKQFRTRRDVIHRLI